MLLETEIRREICPNNEECPDTSRHPGYYEKIIYCLIHLSEDNYSREL